MKRLLTLVLCAACLCTSAFAASTGTAKVGGSTAKTVAIDAGEIASADVFFGQGSVNKDQTAADIVKTAAGQGKLLAAVNGGFFNAYYKAGDTIDDPAKAARCYANVVRDGMAVNGCGGDQSAVYLGFTKDGKPLIDEVDITLYVSYSGKTVPTWGVNSYYPESNATLLFTPEAGYDLPLYAGAKAAKIVNGKVTEIMSSGTMVCAPDTYYFVCGGDLLHHIPSVGTPVSFVTEFSKDAWKNVTTAVSCGPWLLHNGQNVFAQNSKYGYLASQKVSEDSVAQRTFAAITASGGLLLGTCSASPRQVTQYLQSIGATDAMLLDGGASSMLYANGTTLTAAGRKLNNVIAIYGAAEEAAPAATPKLSVTVGGSPVEWLVGNEPFIDANGRTMVPLRAVGNALGLTVDWDGSAREASFTDGSKTIYFPIDKSTARTGDGKTIPMDTTAVIVNNSTYAPVRYLAEFFGRTVDWDGSTRTVIIK